MDGKIERILAYLIATIFLVVGVVCYAAFPNKAPEEPIRLMLQSSAGKILFDHKEHSSEAGYDLSCTDCHHNMEEDETPSSCGECHEPESEDPIKRSEAFHLQCKGCHDDSGSGPVECSECHVM